MKINIHPLWTECLHMLDQNVYEFILLFNCFTHFCFFFILLILIEEEVKPSYNDLKEQMPELKTLIFDMNEIMPDIKNSFVMLKNICVSDEFKHLCKHYICRFPYDIIFNSPDFSSV